MKISTSYLFQSATEKMSETQVRLAQKQAQLATGKELVAPSDAPEKAAAIQRLKGGLLRQESYLNTIENVLQRYRLEETALNGMSDNLMRFSELAIQAANDTLAPGDRQAIAIEMKGLRDHLISLANSQSTQGQYLFAGGAGMTQRAPYALQEDGRVAYFGDAAKMEVKIGDSLTAGVGRNARDSLGRVIRTNEEGESFGVGFFDVVDQLVNAVEEGRVQDFGRGVQEIDQLHQNVVLALASVGANSAKAENQRAVLEETILRLETTLSEVEDLDYTEAITQMNQQMLALEAAQSSFAKIAQLNLFNYIN